MTAATRPQTDENLISNALRYGAAAPAITQKGRAITFANVVEDPAIGRFGNDGSDETPDGEATPNRGPRLGANAVCP